MKIVHIELKKLKIPFRVAFKHAAAERTVTETVIAFVHSQSGLIGYGEGCPRAYVTGESMDSCIEFATQYRLELLAINSLAVLKTFLIEHQSAIDQNPAAWCALETALLDLIGKTEKKSVESVLGLPEIQGHFIYTAVLGVSDPKIFQKQLKQYLNMGFHDFKVKISGNTELDTLNLAYMREKIPAEKIRLDANNVWKSTQEALRNLSAYTPHFWAIEEPINARDYLGLQDLAVRLQCKIILDESFLHLQDFANIAKGPAGIFILNIRISKMGGLLRALAVAQECKQRGMKFVIGAQVGETSILTRVALSLANAHRDALIAQEGAYGTHLLEYDLIEPPLMFSKSGLLTLKSKNSEGLGINVKS